MRRLRGAAVRYWIALSLCGLLYAAFLTYAFKHMVEWSR